MLFLHPLHSLSPPSFFLLLGDFGVLDVPFDLGDFATSEASDGFDDFGFAGDFGVLGFTADLADLGFAGRLCFFKTLAFSSLANSDFRIS